MWGLQGTETFVLAAYVCGLRSHMTSLLATPCLWRLRGTQKFVLGTLFGLRGYRVDYTVLTTPGELCTYIFYEENAGCRD